MFCNPAAAHRNADEHMYLVLKMLKSVYFQKRNLLVKKALHISCHSFELEIWNLIKLCSAIQASTAKGTLHTL